MHSRQQCKRHERGSAECLSVTVDACQKNYKEEDDYKEEGYNLYNQEGYNLFFYSSFYSGKQCQRQCYN